MIELVATSAELERAVTALSKSRRFYLDTEFESARQGKRLSLVQLRVDADPGAEQPAANSHVFVFDALRLPSLEPLKKPLLSADAEWVLHAGLQDVELLVDALGVSAPPRLFDTQIAWGLLGPEASVSLAYLQYKILGLRKMKAYQADDWLRRPLPKEQLHYAADDVVHLPAIAGELGRRAELLNRGGIIEQASRSQLVPEADPAEQLTLASFRNAWQLEARNLAALSAMIDWYNRDQLPHRACPAPKVLFNVASRLPATPSELGRIKGVHAEFVRDCGRALLDTMRSALSRPESLSPEPPPYASYRELHVEAQLGLMRARVCEKLQVAAELALPSKLLRAMQARIIAQGAWRAAMGTLSGWREQLLRQELEAFLETQERELPF